MKILKLLILMLRELQKSNCAWFYIVCYTSNNLIKGYIMRFNSYSFNGNGKTTCKCCEKKLSSKNIYDGVCSSHCSSKI